MHSLLLLILLLRPRPCPSLPLPLPLPPPQKPLASVPQIRGTRWPAPPLPRLIYSRYYPANRRAKEKAALPYPPLKTIRRRRSKGSKRDISPLSSLKRFILSSAVEVARARKAKSLRRVKVKIRLNLRRVKARRGQISVIKEARKRRRPLTKRKSPLAKKSQKVKRRKRPSNKKTSSHGNAGRKDRLRF